MNQLGRAKDRPVPSGRASGDSFEVDSRRKKNNCKKQKKSYTLNNKLEIINSNSKLYTQNYKRQAVNSKY